MSLNGRERSGRESGGIVEDLTPAQRAEAGVKMIELRGSQFESDHRLAKGFGDDIAGRLGRTLAITRPKNLAAFIPKAVAGPLVGDAVRKLDNLGDHTLGLELLKSDEKHRLFALTLAAVEPCHQGRAIQYRGCVGRKH